MLFQPLPYLGVSEKTTTVKKNIKISSIFINGWAYEVLSSRAQSKRGVHGNKELLSERVTKVPVLPADLWNQETKTELQNTLMTFQPVIQLQPPCIPTGSQHLVGRLTQSHWSGHSKVPWYRENCWEIPNCNPKLPESAGPEQELEMATGTRELQLPQEPLRSKSSFPSKAGSFRNQ